MPRADDLLRLSFAAVGSSPQRPFVARANGIHGIPELGRDPGIRRVLQHADALAVSDLPPDFAAKLEVVALVVNRPRLIRLQIDGVVGAGNQLFERQRLLARQNADVRHPDNGQPVPALGAQRSTGPARTNRCLLYTSPSPRD